MSATRTKSMPGDHDPPLIVIDPITHLREAETGRQWPLPAASPLRVGKDPACEIVLDSPYVSSVHCVLKRHGPLIEVVDQGSKNGIFRDRIRLSRFEVWPGKAFEAARTTLIPLSDAMVASTPPLEPIFGLDQHARISAALTAGALSLATVIAGPPGSCHHEVAALLHRCSTRRMRPHVAVDALASLEDVARAGAGSALFEVTTLPARGGRNALAVIDDILTRGRLILYIAAPDRRTAARRLGEHYRSMDVLEIPPIEGRSATLVSLLDRLFADAGVTFTASSAGMRNLAALTRYSWPRNLAELRQTARRLPVLVAHGGITRAAAEELGESRSGLQEWATKVGLRFANQQSDG